MMVMGQQKAIAAIIAGSLAFNMIVSVAFTLVLGITGAALASSLSIILRIFLMRRACQFSPSRP
jgi:peptidoglycan biosynthesis protein MviN/MurJ (putative lipid II flippase)